MSVQNSPLNKSKSKQQYSFSKDPRFKHNGSIQYVDKFYDIPSTKDQRATSLGIGSKSNLLNKSLLQTPGPQRYNIQREFQPDQIQRTRRGFSFGLGREMVEYGNMLSKKRLNVDIPGPGNYQIKSTLTNISFSLKPRTPTGEENLSFKKGPGPGNYQNILSLQPTGKYPISNFKNYGRTIIHPILNIPKRSQYETLAPGPGRYEAINGLNPQGKYSLSNMQNSRVRSFSISKRQQLLLETTKGPGPGAYTIFSEFGKN